MKNLLILFLLIFSAPSLSLDVGGQLRNALLEKLTADPIGYEGRIYYNTTDQSIRVYTGSSWVALGSPPSLLTPVGALMPYAGNTAPSGWLLADGSAVSRTTYASLFAVLGTTYGAGDGSTTFNLPDLRGRVPAGKDDMGGVAANRLTSGGSGVDGVTLGAQGGSETHTLLSSEIPSHAHGAGTFSTSISGTTVASSSHNHNMAHNHQIGHMNSSGSLVYFKTTSDDSSTSITTGDTQIFGGSLTTTTGGFANRAYITIGSTYNFYSTGVLSPPSGSNGSSAATGTPSSTASSVSGSNEVTGSSASTGDGGSHQNTQPTLVLNYIIKAD